jgi:hypothetical protein
MESIKLSSQQLAYLLALVGSNGLAGVEHAHIPPSAETADAVYAVGLEQLKAQGWLTPGDEADSYELDQGLLDVITTLAFPNHLVLTVRASNEGLQHYISDQHTMQVLALKGDVFQIDAIQEPLEMGAAVVSFVTGKTTQAIATGAAPTTLPKQTALFNVVRVQGSDVLAGRKATVHGDTWLSYRVSRDAPDMRNIAFAPADVAAVTGEFIRSLA